jgi:hypothetical protein
MLVDCHTYECTYLSFLLALLIRSLFKKVIFTKAILTGLLKQWPILTLRLFDQTEQMSRLSKFI